MTDSPRETDGGPGDPEDGPSPGVAPSSDPRRLQINIASTVNAVSGQGALQINYASPPGPHERALDALAKELEAWWSQEIKKRRLVRPLIPVCWSSLGPRQYAGDAGVSGQIDQVPTLADGYLALPSRRLLLVGGRGSGKTATAMLLADELFRRHRARQCDQIPVFLSVSSWDVQTGLSAWMVQRILAEYRPVAEPTLDWQRLVIDLLHQNRLIPVLDGLDELPSAHRAEALRTIDEATGEHALVVTCRTTAFEEITAAGGRLRAAVSRAEPVPVDVALAYLQDPAHSRAGLWDAYSRQSSAIPEHLRQVFSNAHLLSLLRDHYGSSARRPDELLDQGRFPDRGAVAGYLYEGILRTYAVAMNVGADGRGWKPEPARRWITQLARHLDQFETYDILLTQLPQAVGRGQRMGLGAVFGLCFALIGILARPLLLGLTIGLAAGLTVGVVIASLRGRQRGGRTPLPVAAGGVKTRMPFSSGRKGAAIRAKGPLFIAAFGGFFGLLGGLLLGVLLTGLPRPGACAAAAGWGVLVGALVGYPGWQPERPASGFGISRPFRQQIGEERKNNLLFAGSAAAALSGAVALLGWFTGGIVVGALLGALATFVVDRLSMWWWSYAIAVLLLAAARRFPYRLVDFLEDSYDLDVLRRVGGVYQFRHAELQDHLASTPAQTDRS